MIKLITIFDEGEKSRHLIKQNIIPMIEMLRQKYTFDVVGANGKLLLADDLMLKIKIKYRK